MQVMAIRLDMTDELHLRVLDAIFGAEQKSVRVKPADLAKELDESEEVIRYNIKKLKRLGYIRIQDNKYEPTEKVVFLKKKVG